jgi:hypothetical protein
MINVTIYHDFYIYLFVARCLVRLRKQYEALADHLVVDISTKCPKEKKEKRDNEKYVRPPAILPGKRATLDPSELDRARKS